MKYRENCSIIFMRDNGPRRSFRVHRGRFLALLAVVACLPFLCAVLGRHCWLLSEQNAQLRETVTRFEIDCQAARATAERLEAFETLLREENVAGRELVLRRLGTASSAPAAAQPESGAAGRDVPAQPAAAAQGQEKHLTDVDLAYVKVDNVLARAGQNGTVRLMLELRNNDSQNTLAGEVRGFLLTADGRKLALRFDPEDAGGFRISRFKRADLTAVPAEPAKLADARVLVEVHDLDRRLVYRHCFDITP